MKPIKHGDDPRCTCRPCPNGRDAMFWREDEQVACETRFGIKMNMAVDPMVKAMKKAYRSSDTFKADQLLAEQSRWLRKRTIAENKLADVRRRMDALLKELAAPKGEVKT